MEKNKIQKFMYMLIKEASRNSLVELCEGYGINEEEVGEIMEYIKEKLDIEIY